MQCVAFNTQVISILNDIILNFPHVLVYVVLFVPCDNRDINNSVKAQECNKYRLGNHLLGLVNEMDRREMDDFKRRMAAFALLWSWVLLALHTAKMNTKLSIYMDMFIRTTKNFLIATVIITKPRGHP